MVFDAARQCRLHRWLPGHKAANLGCLIASAAYKWLNKDAPVLVYCYHGNSSQGIRPDGGFRSGGADVAVCCAFWTGAGMNTPADVSPPGLPPHHDDPRPRFVVV